MYIRYPTKKGETRAVEGEKVFLREKLERGENEREREKIRKRPNKVDPKAN